MKYKKRKDGRYETKVNAGRDEDGKYIRIPLYAKTQRELDDKVAETKILISKGYDPRNKDITLGEYAEHWLSAYKSNRRTNTRLMYENIVKAIKGDVIGEVLVEKIKKSDLQAFVNKNSRFTRKCEQIKLTLKQIFDTALEDSLVIKNVATRLELPTRKKSIKRALTPLEIEAIKKIETDEDKRMFLLVLFYLGLRRGESIALTKKDFDFKENIVSIERSITFDKNNPIIEDTKNESSNRCVPIPKEIANELKAYVKSLDSLYLFCKNDGSLMTHSAYRKFWEDIIKQLNKAVMSDAQWTAIESMDKKVRAKNRPINTLTAHIFRHNYATMLYYSNISVKKAADLLGHCDIKMIMEVYAHLDEERENTKEKLDQAIVM